MAMKSVEVKVTQEHIDRGKRRDCAKCPVTLAADELVKPDVHLTTGKTYIYWCDPWIDRTGDLEVQEAVLPAAAIGFIVDFDMGTWVAPFTFTIELPEEILK